MADYLLPFTASEITDLLSSIEGKVDDGYVDAAIAVALRDFYSKNEIDKIMESYINDIDNLIGGGA